MFPDIYTGKIRNGSFMVSMPPLNTSCLYEENISSSTVTLMDIRNLAEITGTYDGIVCGFCIPYLNTEETNRLVDTAARLLNPEGILYLSFVEGDPAKSGLVTASTGDQTYFYYHHQDELIATLQKAGFEKRQPY